MEKEVPLPKEPALNVDVVHIVLEHVSWLIEVDWDVADDSRSSSLARVLYDRSVWSIVASMWPLYRLCIVG